MADSSIFSNRELYIRGNMIQTYGNMNIIITKNSSPEDIMEIIDNFQYNVLRLGIEKKQKMEVENQLDNLKIQIENKDLNIESIKEKISKVNQILKETKTSSENLNYFGELIGKIAVWLGTTAAKLGWIL